MPVAPPRRLSVLALVALLVLACGDEPGTTPPTPAGKASVPAGARTEPPAGNPQAGGESVAFEASDGVKLQGHLYSSPGPKRKLVVFAHDATRDQITWSAFAKELAAAGIAALTFDFRGYGETGGTKDSSKADADLEAAIRFAGSREYPLIYAVGADLGGTAVLKVASRRDLAGVVAISAPLSVAGLDARSDLSKISEPKLYIAARNDAEAQQAAGVFGQNAPEPRETKVLDGSAHGSAFFQDAGAAAFKQAILDFISK